MAFERPRFIDLSDQRPASGAALRQNTDDESPRIQHMDGDIPPALSPLDAFAAHSRRLARELEETRGTGERRMSRLPPQHITKSLGELKENRPLIFRQLSGERDQVPPWSPISRQNSGPTPQYGLATDRPKSSYVRLSAVPGDQAQEVDSELFYTPAQSLYSEGENFSVPHTQSPTGIDMGPGYDISPDGTADFSLSLTPPNPAFARAAYHESSEDEYASSNNGSTFSQARKLSSSSGVSLPQSPASPYCRTHERSVSAQSISPVSTPGNKKNRPRINFSRPMSSSSLHNLVQHCHLSPTRQGSTASRGSHVSSVLARLPTPATSFDEERSLQSDSLTAEYSSYSQMADSLPRGRQSDRTFALFPDSTLPPLEWKEPVRPNTPPLDGRSSLSDPSHQDLAQGTVSPAGPAQSPIRPLIDIEARVATASESPPSSFSPPPTCDQAARSQTTASTTPLTGLSIPRPPVDLASSTDSQSNSTIRPTAGRAQNDYQALSADEHVTKAIDLHEHGDLKESTYHLRIAAKQNHPTGMLLYALACRHGWGMRPNPTEGVQWLRKAVDLSQLEVAEDENPNPTSNRRQADFVEKKAHRAQFALSVYELGQCHLNGWGMEMDKALALRCFEMAGTWGDVDALTEAGFCYAQGIGCKKDLKKAAKWYREAEKRGANTVGNSWIHKEKYSDNNDDKKNRLWKASTPNNGKTDKSKTKTRRIARLHTMSLVLDKTPPSAIALSLSSLLLGLKTSWPNSYDVTVHADSSDDEEALADDEREHDDDDSDHNAGNPFTDSADEVKLVLVTRTDLGMTKGKIAAQCGHATLACYKALAATPAHAPLLRRWEGAGQPKIALQAKGGQDQLETLLGQAISLGLCAKVIRDAGRTQIEAGSMTVLGILGPKSVVDQVTGELKLL
ncbi:hypothetical protein DV736_g6483, partial [Chaetothyriales sp. CBS 134916]